MGTTLALVALVVFGSEAPPRVLVVDPAHSKLRYFFDHDLHDVSGTSKAVEAKLMVWPDRKTQLMVRAAVASFKSGDANRDVHTQEVLEAAKYPYVVFKAALQLPEPPSPPRPWPLKLKGELDFHGRKRMETVEFKVVPAKDGAIVATGTFVVSLERYEVERPSLLFVKLNDDCQIDFEIKLVEKKK